MRKHVIRQATTHFSAHQIYDLVNDTVSYPRFIPYCVAGRVIEGDEHKRIAELTFGFHGVTQTIRTQNAMTPYERIDVKLIDGPLRVLEGHWLFKPLSHQPGCEVYVDFQYEIESSWVSMAFEPIFMQVLQQMVDCFCNEAEQRYGTV